MSDLICAECEGILNEGSACIFFSNTYCTGCLDDLTQKKKRMPSIYDNSAKCDAAFSIMTVIFSSKLCTVPPPHVLPQYGLHAYISHFVRVSSS